MIEYRKNTSSDIRMVFSQSPPGLGGLLLDVDLVHELAEKNVPIGWTFSYKPDNPAKDFIFEDCCFPTDNAIRHASGRLLADNDRSIKMIEAISPDKSNYSGSEICDRMFDYQNHNIDIIPNELELEITTESHLSTFNDQTTKCFTTARKYKRQFHLHKNR